MSGAVDLRPSRDPADDASGDYMNDVEYGNDAALLEEAEASVDPDLETEPVKLDVKPGAGTKTKAPTKPGAATKSKDMDALAMTGAIVGDITGGFAESPKAIVKGGRDALQEFLDTTKSVGDWLNHNVGDLGAVQVFDKQGNFDPQYFPVTPNDNGPQLPLGGIENKTATGNVITGITQFLVGYAAGGKLLKSVGLSGKLGTIGEAALKGMFSDAFAFDPAQERLSNLIQTVPALQNPVTDFLSAKPDDSEAFGRFKAAMEGLGLGAATTAVFATALRGTKYLRELKAEAPPPELKPDMVAPLGDMAVEAPLVTKVTPKQAERMMAQAEKATAKAGADQLRPSTEAETIAGAATKIRGEIYTGKTHAEAIEKFTKKTGMSEDDAFALVDKGEAVDGFVTSGGLFVGRDEAAKIAKARDQINQDSPFVRKFPNAPLVAENLKDIPGSKPSGASAGKNAQGDEVYFNFARVDSPEDVKALMGETQKLFKGDIEKAQRGVQSFEATKALADDMGMTVEELLNRPRAEGGARTPFTAEEALAARRLYTASSTKLMELAERAAGPNAGDVDMFNFRKMMATHYAIQQEVIGARTETARALASWRIPAGSGAEQLKAIQDTLQMAGGAANAKEMAKRLAILKANGASAKDIAKFVRKGVFGKGVDAVREVWINGLLSSPTTHIVNTSSNMLVAMQSIYERGAARAISTATGSDAVVHGEAMAMGWAFLEAQKDAFRLAWKAVKTGETTDLLGKVEMNYPRALSAEAMGMRQTGAGRAVDMIGGVMRTPSRLLGAEDQYFKTIGYRMELRAQAVRQATGEGLKGEAFARRITDLIENPPENLRIASVDAALYNTFTNQTGKFGQAIQNLRNAGGAANPMWLVLPFIKTPVNIARYAFERTPMAPLVGQWRADIAAGGARRDLALARAASGTAIMGIAMAWKQDGTVSGAGPSDPGERAAVMRQGWQPYSVKVGDKWYSYNRADPFGMTMGFAADIEDALARGEMAPEDVDEWQEVMAAGIAAVAEVTTSKTFLRGFSQFNEVIADPKRYSSKYVSDMMASFIPFTSLVGTVERIADPTMREATNPLEAIQAKIPGLAARMAPVRDLWGQERKRDSGYGAAYDALSPIAASKIKDSPIDAELERLRYFPDRIKWKTSINGVPVNLKDFPQVYSEYQRLAGNAAKHPAWGLGAKDFLDQVVTGTHAMSPVYKIYSDGEEGGKAAFIRSTIQEYRKLAADKILSDPKYIKFQVYYAEQAALTGGARQRIQVSN
jgi:hypothetical protein